MSIACDLLPSSFLRAGGRKLLTRGITALVLGSIALLALSIAPCLGASKSYADCVLSAIAELDEGKTRESLEILKQALEINANDSLAHVALGLTLLMGGQVADADAEFAVARSLDGNCVEAIYGQGLIALSKGRTADAISLFCEAEAKDSTLGARGAIRYARFLANSDNEIDSPNTDDEALLALDAVNLAKRGRWQESLEIWQRLQPKAARPGFGERIGCSMTFIRSKSIYVTGWPLKTGFRSALVDRSKLPTVSGKIVLRADLSKARSVSIVSFFVDDKLVGVTNRQPFEYTWDTSYFANGVHTVKITGADSTGLEVSRKTAQVIVNNVGANPQPDRTAQDAAVWEKLRNILRLKPSAAAINYNLAQCAIRKGDNETAIAALERVMAADPDYPGASDLLSKLYWKGDPTSLYGVASAGKLIALTFDDGPKPETISLLDALKQIGIKATFFVVGKQVEAYPQILKRIDAEGHEIQNHTYGHRALEYLSEKEIEQELFKCAAVVRSVTGKGMNMLRPPGARHDRLVSEVVRRYGMRLVFWTTNCVSLEGTERERMTNYVVSSARPGAIVLMHNVDRVTLGALPAIVDALRRKGYSFVTLSELINRGKSGA